MYESERGRVLHWVYTVLSSGKMSTLHSSFFPQLTFTASKSRQTALNQMEQLHPKWQVPLFKGSSFTLPPPPPEVLTHLLCEAKENLYIHNQNSFIGRMFVSVTFELIVLALQCCLKHSVCLFYRHILSQKNKNRLSQRSLARSRGNLATVNIHSQGFL